MMKLSGGQALVKILENLGVEVAFGVPGFQALPYYNAILHSDKIRHILVRNEQAGAFMADAYARSSGKVAVCDGTCGPGATNLITGLSESFNASIPVIAITSNVVTMNSGRGANMETDQRGSIRPFVKDSIFITDAIRIPELVRKAYYTAMNGKPGPVHIDLPENVFYAEADYEECVFDVSPIAREPIARFIPAIDQLERACDMLQQAEFPVMVCGGGAHNSDARQEVQALAELLDIPVATTISGKGIISENHPLSMNVFGRYFRFANEYINKADVLFVVGCKLGEMSTIRWSFIRPGTKIIHLEIDPPTINKAYTTELGLVGDAKASLAQMIKILEGKGAKSNPDAPIYGEIAASAVQWRKDVADKIDDDGMPINIAHMLAVLQKYAPDNVIMVGDGGFSAHWSSVYWTVSNNDARHYIANRGQAAIGYGLPGALGAKIANPDKPVITLSGDGGLAYSIMEIETAVREKIPVILIVVNNMCLGYIKALEHFQFGEYISTDLSDICYADMAKIFGCYGKRVIDPKDLDKEFQDALKRTDMPSIIEVMVTTDPTKMLPGWDNRIKK
jgi:acetolactate synthase-1/2/3 large subunit